MKKPLLICLFLLGIAVAHAGSPTAPKAEQPSSVKVSAPRSDTERYSRRCQSHWQQSVDPEQGTLLWGTRRSWDTRKEADERSSVLVSVELEPQRRAEGSVNALKLEGGHLAVVPASAAEAGAPPSGIIGSVLQGAASDGKPVEVAICGAEPSPDDPSMLWYHIEAWNPVAQEWQNPCVAVSRVPDPRALAVEGGWDTSGAHQHTPGRFTFACENSAITQCIRWGYKPWASRQGHSLAELHQACTRMARADYCGDGRSHTRIDALVDIYDRFGLLSKTTEASVDWDPAKASFEAAWAPEGATCLARTRDGRALATVLQECPDRLQQGAVVDLGQGDRCTVRRVDMSPEMPLLRNLSYGAFPRDEDRHVEGG